MSKSKKVGFGLVVAGLMFFVNPNVQLFDVFPDAIGALLIYCGLKKAACVDGYFEDARKISFALIWIYVLKFVFSISLVSHPANSLPFTFISGVLELIFLGSFIHKLYAGFEYTTMRCAAGKTPNLTNNIYALSMIFVAVKCIITFVPEMFEFIKQGEDLDLSANASYTMSVASLKPYAVLLSIVVQLALGILFAVQTVKFFRNISKDYIYMGHLSEAYAEEVGLNRKKYVNRAVSSSLMFMAASVIFVAGAYIDGFDFLPDVMAVICMTLAFVCLAGARDDIKVPKILCAVSLVISGAYTAFSAYVRPELFELLTKEKTAFTNHSDGFWNSGVDSALFSIAGFVFAVIYTVLVIVMMIKQQRLYMDEKMGNHDRKLMTVIVLSGLAALSSASTSFFDACAAHLAATHTVVAQYITDRPRMTAQMMAQRIAENTKVAHFDSVDNFGIFMTYVTIALVVFAFFNILALKSHTTKKD